MYRVLFTRPGYDFGFSWTFKSLAEAYQASKDLESTGHIAKIVRVQN